MNKSCKVAIIGAGPSGLSAAIVLAEDGVDVLVLDENPSAGGQLFKQIHKFFGSENHMAGVRGIEIGEILLDRCRELNIPIHLNTSVWGLFPDLSLSAVSEGKPLEIRAEGIIAATGAGENALAFPGWTLPGVMGAGAAQTLVNFYRVRPGNRALIVGAGNVGLIVAYQLLQAGIEVAAVVEGAPDVGGYTVHAAKIRRMAIPILTEHTIVRAEGTDHVEKCTVAAVDSSFQVIENTEIEYNVDMVCVAVGLSPAIELLRTIDIPTCYVSELGGDIPLHNESLMTKKEGIFIAGDISGVEEASSAMEEGKLAAVSAAEYSGAISTETADKRKEGIYKNLAKLRGGPFGQAVVQKKQDIFMRYRDGN
jgi:NADPH-dependent 2,4-dienoyl-CoA reductase/sulfur reductase-like enzyme